jgi:hypothetical protein
MASKCIQAGCIGGTRTWVTPMREFILFTGCERERNKCEVTKVVGEQLCIRDALQLV